ncbi:MAG: TetR/AcrR family transcriptional regulator [Acidiferrobacteraceae bacterium]
MVSVKRGDPGKTVKRRLKAPARKAQILSIASALFARKGSSVSIDELASACDVSAAVLYQHFASKEELYRTVLLHAARRRADFVEAVLAGPSDFGSVLYRMTLVYVRDTLEDADILRMELRSALDGEKGCPDFLVNHWNNFSEYIEHSLRELIEEGEIEPLDTGCAALMFQGMLRELVYTKTIQKSERYRAVDEGYLVRALIEHFLRAVGVKPRDGRRFSEVGAAGIGASAWHAGQEGEGTE